MRLAVELGAWACGFVLSASPRRVTPERAGELAARPPAPLTVAVVTTEPAEWIAAALAAAGLGAVQLSAGADGPTVAAVRAAAARRGLRPLVIAAADTPDAADADLVLLDARGPGVYGGTGARSTGRRWLWRHRRPGAPRARRWPHGGQRRRGHRHAAARPPSTSAAASRRAPGVKDEALLTGFFAAVAHPRPIARCLRMSVQTHFGPYGGRFVPETLIPALDELTQAYEEARADAAFQAELARLLADYAGRPTPLYHAARLSERCGATVLLKREDLCHTGAHKINNVLGQALLAKRMGKQRVIAETGAGQHGVATATACALLDLECVVYMGAEDIRRQELNVVRMRLLGATVVPVESGSRTLKDAMNEALRDWVTNVATTFYVIGSVAGPAPYPAMVRDFQAVIGDEAIAQVRQRFGHLPDEVVACVGGGSNAMGLFHAFRDLPVRLTGVEAAGEGLDGRHGAPLRQGQAGRAARLVQLPAAGRLGSDRRGALGVGRARLPRRRAGAVVAEGLKAGAFRGGHRRGSPGRLQRPRPSRGDHPGARERPRHRLRAARALARRRVHCIRHSLRAR